MKRFAFTMLELVFVILIIAILAVLALPNFNKDLLAEGADHVITDLRYTQHLAMNDDKFDPNDMSFSLNPGYSPTYDHKWFREYWRTRFYTSSANVYYAVFSDEDREGNIDTLTHTEPAIDPLTGTYLYVGNTANDPKNNLNMNLTDTFGITAVTSTCDAGNIDIYFDNIGRPLSGSLAGADPYNPYSALLHNDCNITLTSGARNAVITIKPETGYVSLAFITPQ